MLRFTTVAIQPKVWIQTSLLPSMLSVTMDVTMKLSLFVGHDILHPWDPFLGAHMFLFSPGTRQRRSGCSASPGFSTSCHWGIGCCDFCHCKFSRIITNLSNSNLQCQLKKCPATIFFDFIHAKKTRLTFFSPKNPFLHFPPLPSLHFPKIFGTFQSCEDVLLP